MPCKVLLEMTVGGGGWRLVAWGGNEMPLECCHEPIFCFGLFEREILLLKQTSINSQIAHLFFRQNFEEKNNVTTSSVCVCVVD